MNSQSGYIAAGTQQLHYLKWGSGRRLLLAFHGYGNDAGLFTPLKPYLEKEYTILSFDLPHHGKSAWAEGSLFTKNDLVNLVERLMAVHGVDKVSLAGYSMGGRMCLSIVEGLPASIDKVILIAADGLTKNFYYYFFTRTLVGKKIFRHLMSQPAPYFTIMGLLAKGGLVHPSRHKFAMHYLQSERSRNFLLNVWGGMSNIIPDTGKVKTLIKKYSIPVSIFMGRYDRIIPVSLAEKFKSGLDTVQLFTLEKGHRVFDQDNADQIAKSLL